MGVLNGFNVGRSQLGEALFFPSLVHKWDLGSGLVDSISDSIP